MKTLVNHLLWICSIIVIVLTMTSCSSDDEPLLPTDENKTEIGTYVDLGLSVKWATCNIGATTPEEIGS